MKRLLISITLFGAIALLSGCGFNNCNSGCGYVRATNCCATCNTCGLGYSGFYNDWY